MNKIILLISFLLFSIFVYCQRKGDIGIILGGSYYLGDLNTSKHFFKTHPAYGAIYRHNFNPRYSIRASVIFAEISGNDADLSFNYQKIRNYKFLSSILDIAAQVEFNFLPYSSEDDKDYYSPYVFLGAAYCKAWGATYQNQLVIPVGVGFKLNLTNRISTGLEWSFRKTFTDHLDGLAGIENLGEIDPKSNYRQRGYFNNKDWYSIAAIFITYKFRLKYTYCPAYDY